MRAIQVTRHGPPDVLEEVRLDPVEPGPGEVRIRVRAAGVSYVDVLAREGVLPFALPPPFVPGFEVSGTVEAIGPGPTRHEVGRHVVALTRFGGYADSVVASGDLTFEAPSVLSHNEAAAVPLSYITAMVALYRMANVKAGETVLVHGVSGGVGVAALQLARLRRAIVIGTASTTKHNAMRSLGIDHVVDRAGPVTEAVLDLTRGRGVDVILDPGDDASLASSRQLLAPLGRLVAHGLGLTRAAATGHAGLAYGASNRGVFDLDVFQLWSERRFLHAAMEALLIDLRAGRLKPVVAKAFPLARAADSHRAPEDRAAVGRIVLMC